MPVVFPPTMALSVYVVTFEEGLAVAPVVFEVSVLLAVYPGFREEKRAIVVIARYRSVLYSIDVGPVVSYTGHIFYFISQ